MTIQTRENFISKKDAIFIVKNFSKNLSSVEDRPGFFEDLFFRKPIKFDKLVLDPNNNFSNKKEAEASAMINNIMYLASEEIQKTYGVKITKFFGGMTRLVAGALHEVHSDTHHLDGTPIDDDPESKYIKYSALLYLSDYNKDFTGGLLRFPNQSIEIQPTPGLFVFFESDHRNPHQVTEIKSGERHSIIMFFG
jgi:Rps23 Pro-64 3,4-dihydroxylase Tpa1-like proline 4-hydroxylase